MNEAAVGYGVPDLLTTATIDGAALLNNVRKAIRTYCVLPDENAYTAVTLWVAYTHCASAFDYAPRLVIRSSLKRSGKTRLLEVIDGLTVRTVRTSSASVAYLFRIIGEGEPPIILIDEADALFGTRVKADQNEDLRSLLNAGFQRGSTIGRVGGKGHDPKTFQTFAPAALAGIGRLPDTIEDRAVVIQMRRRKPSESVSPFRLKRDGPGLADLCARLSQWSEELLEQLEGAEPELPVDDRAADTWEPLVAVADAASRDWGLRARAAAIQFAQAAEADEGQSRELMLLTGIREVFRQLGEPFVGTNDLLQYLALEDESPWADLTAAALGRRLRGFGVLASHSSDRRVRGYRKRDFEDTFDRYLPPRARR